MQNKIPTSCHSCENGNPADKIGMIDWIPVFARMTNDIQNKNPLRMKGILGFLSNSAGEN
ncbi:TPA: hypothetical protein DCZ36_00380 [Candidatus Gracilibacteria bacterium]|nr:hypothetical protein [Candidatus Gracilibacteria bacterium]